MGFVDADKNPYTFCTVSVVGAPTTETVQKV